jgi:hypothetical protein
MPAQFVISGNDLMKVGESANLWSSETWTDHLANSLQTIESPVSRTSALLLSVIDDSNSTGGADARGSGNGTAVRSQGTRANIWSQLSHERAIDVLEDFLFNREPGSMVVNARE